jgi:hypothetical protein
MVAFESNNQYALDKPALKSSIQVNSTYVKLLASNAMSSVAKGAVKYVYGSNETSIPFTTVFTNLTDPPTYLMHGSFVDYLNIGASPFESTDNRFLLSNCISGENWYILNAYSTVPEGASSDIIVDKADYVHSIIDYSTEVPFSERDSAIVGKKSDSNSPVEVIVGYSAGTDGTKLTYDTPYFDRQESDSARGSGDNANIFANIHIEPISYIVKNRLAGSDGVNVGGYSISKLNTTYSVYSLEFANNGRSGYKIPFYTKNRDIQMKQSSYNTCKLSTASDLDFRYEPDVRIYVIPGSEYTQVVFVNSADDVTFESKHALIRKAYTILIFENKYLDPFNSSFNSKTAIVNESNNVVSIRCDYIRGYRAGTIESKHTSLLVGLTEVGDVGGVCSANGRDGSPAPTRTTWSTTD